MNNILYNQTVGSNYTVQTFDSSGSLVALQQFPSSAQSIVRNVTSTSGPKPKPLVPRPYHINCQRSRCTTLHYRQQNVNGSYILASGPILHPGSNGYTLLPSWSEAALYNKAISRLGDNVRGDLDVSVDLAELGKTRKMLKLADSATDFTRTFVKRFGIIKVASKAWLTYQYGIQPLMRSIFGLAEENLRHVMGQSQNYFVRVSEVYVPTHVEFDHCLAGRISLPVISSSIKKSITIGLDLRQDAFDPSRFSSLNPLSIAWELTPLSFVADWFFTLGSYLRNMETYVLHANKFHGGYLTRLSVGTVTATARTSMPPMPLPSTNTYSEFNGWHLDINRTVLSSYPAPNLPRLKAQLGSSRLLTSAALMGQLLLGRK